jgi:hypothetical protein
MTAAGRLPGFLCRGEHMQPIIDFVIQWGPIAVTAAAAAAAALPQGAPGSTWSLIRKGLDFLAMNFGNAKNLAKNVSK